MDLGLDGRTALVTGSWRGTGVGIARVLAAEGCTVLVHGLEPGQADGVVEELTDAGGTAHSVHGDLRNDEGAVELVASVRAVADGVDILVNNYGAADGTTWPTSTGTSWHASYDTNVVSAVRAVNALVDGMRERGWGRIVFVATVGATRPGERIPNTTRRRAPCPG